MPKPQGMTSKGPCRVSEALTLVARRRGIRGFSFGDLVEPAARTGATIGQIAEWMAQSLSHGLIESVVPDPAERALRQRYRIRAAERAGPKSRR
jgi:DNA-binding transcriptional LysR family regulator